MQEKGQQQTASTLSHNDPVTVTLATAAPPLTQNQSVPPKSEESADKGYNYGAWVSNLKFYQFINRLLPRKIWEIWDGFNYKKCRNSTIFV